MKQRCEQHQKHSPLPSQQVPMSHSPLQALWSSSSTRHITHNTQDQTNIHHSKMELNNQFKSHRQYIISLTSLITHHHTTIKTHKLSILHIHTNLNQHLPNLTPQTGNEEHKILTISQFQQTKILSFPNLAKSPSS